MTEILKRSMKIGKLKLDNNLFMAPMAGITDRAFREIVSANGSGLNFTEMVSAKGLYYEDNNTKKLMDRGDESPLGIQIFGSDPDIMGAVVSKYLNSDDRFDLIDINMGCPAPKIVKNGDGSALMKDLKLAARVIEKVVANSEKPVSVKFRLGWDEDNINYLELGKICQDLGVSFVTLHPRTRKAFYSGKADWDAIGELKSRLDIPVIGNGDIYQADDIEKMFKQTNCDGIALARGALENPFLFSRIIEEPTLREMVELIKYHLELKSKYLGEKIAVTEMRKHIAWYLKGFRNSKEIKNKINKVDEKETVVKILNDYLENEE
ncbi:tRNA dihydrouridine synthase DusB [Lagierella sp.]|uniref:tRNA dihydrouridine synthase DusB n=1 Tax=Lagierella sp. TaxID=2849657 RepID=UPI0026311D1E|nr:tRNA dihydrouridine synthase DusB [Lagierella sp.]